MGIRKWWNSRRNKSEPKAAGQKDYNIVVVMRSDGFIPSVQFSGDNLETLLEAAVYSYACITGNSEAIASLPAIIQRSGSEKEDKWVEVQGHQLESLIKHPFGNNNGNPKWSWSQLIETAAQHIYLTGNCWLKPDVTKTRRNPSVKALYPFIEPSKMDAVENQAGVPRYYRYGSDEYNPDEIVNIMNAAPGSYWKGQCPLHAALRDVEIDKTAHLRQKANLENRVAPGIIVEIDGFFGPTEEQKQRVLKDLYDSYQQATQDGTPLVVGKGAKIHPPINTGQVSDIFDTRKFSRDGMLAVFRTPPPIVGVYDNATLQNFNTATKIWWLNALFPMLNTIYSAINNQLIWPIYGDNVRIWYDVTGSDIGLLVLKDRIEAAQGLVNLGYPTNIASRRVGLNMEYVADLDRANVQLIQAGRNVENGTQEE